ncbi:hypothetical protein BKA63DRAFT_74728 [Paraphoma chrysanthemicola]|nr:hypothetical protein BKA63DRAFT_74728 [Paraphoma chrysanthemicola]
MSRLPQEVHDQICDYLFQDDLCRVSYVSKTFRKSAEDQAKKQKADRCQISNKNDLDEFVKQYSGFRLRFLERVEYEIRLPGPDIVSPDSDGEPRGCCESPEERHRRDTAFTEQVRTMFENLQAMEQRAGNRNRGEYHLTIDVTSDLDETYIYCMHRQCSQWRTYLLEPGNLPQVRSVTSLGVTTQRSGAKLDCRIMIDVTKKLPNLNHLECRVGQDEWNPVYSDEDASLFIREYDGPRRDTRHQFGRSIEMGVAPSLQTVELDFICREAAYFADRLHQRKSMPDMISPLSRDPYSSSLRILSYHLKQLTLRAQVDGTLFWPHDDSTPHWPNLESLHLMFHMVSPSGAWYFEGPGGEGHDLVGHDINGTHYPPKTQNEVMTDCYDVYESDRCFESWGDCQFRISPNEAVLVPFLESFAKAAACMPKLDLAVLWSPLRFDPGCDDEIVPTLDYYQPPHEFYKGYIAWGFAYETSEVHWPFSGGINKNKDRQTRRIWWRVGNWRPSEELHAAFRQIGSYRIEEDMQEDWVDEEYGSALVTRNYFEHYTPDRRDLHGHATRW